jgi:hypothetical protein
MRSKKGAVGLLEILKIALIVLVIIILASTLKDMFGKTKKAVLNVVDKQYEEFKYAQGVLYHPDLDQEYVDFWNQGVIPTIKAAFSGSTPCIGSFYSPGDVNLKGVEFRFTMNPGKGIDIFMRDSKSVVALLDPDTLAGARWNLCVIDDMSSVVSLGQNLKSGLSGNSFSFSNIQMTSVDDLYIKIDSMDLDELVNEGVTVGYFTKELRQQINQQAEQGGTVTIQEPRFFYPPYFAGDPSGGYGAMKERFHFFFFIKENNFCIVKTQPGGGTELYPPLLKEFIENRKNSLHSLGWLSSTTENPFCDVPKDDELFDGDRAAFYEGCSDLKPFYDIDVHQGRNDLCIDMSTKHPKLCFVSNSDCVSCQRIETCDDYPDALCNADPCRLDDDCNLKIRGIFRTDKCVVKEVEVV